MAENLKTTKYRNGDTIKKVTSDTSWKRLTVGAHCAFNNNEEYAENYGYLYNWYAAADGRDIAPIGWHVPTDAEWTQLIDYLGGESIAGGKLKSTSGWSAPNTGAMNESGFSALPGGFRNFYGYFSDLTDNAFFWSASESGSTSAWYRALNYYYIDISRYYYYKKCGFSVRLLRN